MHNPKADHEGQSRYRAAFLQTGEKLVKVAEREAYCYGCDLVYAEAGTVPVSVAVKEGDQR